MRPSPKFQASSPRGIALVITMALVILLSFMVIAFFSMVTTNRQIENTSAGGVTARLLAEGAVGAIQADLRQEIIAGSTAVGSGNSTVYYANTPANMVPLRAVNLSATDANFLNVVKQSGVRFFGNATIFNAASSAKSTEPANNGRLISAARWSAPMLTGAEFATGDTPNWIFVNPTGYSVTPTASTIGRIAFNVYDVGGLLNINASGFAPAEGATTYSAEMHRKGMTTWADMRALPGINANAFAAQDSWPAKWRVTGDWGSGSNGFSLFSSDPKTSAAYYERTGWRTAFLNPAGTASDRVFASRQDLIRYAKAYPGTFTKNGNLITGLQHLTHWSRWSNTPTFRHDETRPFTKPVVGGVTSGGNDYNNETARKAANPFFPTVKVATAFQRKTLDRAGNLINRPGIEGTAQPGEPLVKYRFPLNRLALMKRTTTGVGTNHPIYWAFGLTRGNNVSDPWVYSALNASDRIASLEQVAAQNREPNFFELLKAAIHAGSLGKASGAGAQVSRDSIDGNLDLQVWRLGANLIDQYDADSFPTILRLPPGTSWDDTNYLGSGTLKVKIHGIESLPQVQGVTQVWKFFGNPPTQGLIIMQPVLWNPHDITTYSDPGSGTPTKFRVWAYAKDLQYRSVGASTSQPNRSNSVVEFNANPGAFREPNLIAREARDGINAVALGPLASIVDHTNYKWLGAGRTLPAGGLSLPTLPSPPNYYAANSADGLSVFLDYQDTDGTWVTYSALESINHNGFIAFYVGPVIYFAKPDPRTQRFGSFGSQSGATHPGLNSPRYWWYIGKPGEEASWPPSGGQMGTVWNTYANWSVFSGRGSTGDATDTSAITMNTSAAAFRYTDPDGVLRWGDSGFGANGMLRNEQATRPILLNRPFRSVGEMGYAFRDQPWKSIDFFSERSGDSALLDVFCISESPDDGIVANRVSLNSASDQVLKAMMSEGLRRDAGGSNLTSASADLLSDSEVNTVIQAVRAARTTAPFLNRSELVSRVMKELPGTGTSFTIKRQREAVIRALADMVETNNWNFMIDVIAQSGRMRPGGTASTDFIPEGERRRWHFVSIDRSTAKVLDEHGEDFAD
jgi:Tfp pilus assembly protein PilX